MWLQRRLSLAWQVHQDRAEPLVGREEAVVCPPELSVAKAVTRHGNGPRPSRFGRADIPHPAQGAGHQQFVGPGMHSQAGDSATAAQQCSVLGVGAEVPDVKELAPIDLLHS